MASRPVMNSARLRQMLSTVYASETRSGSRLFQASSASRTFWMAESRSNGGTGGRTCLASIESSFSGVELRGAIGVDQPAQHDPRLVDFLPDVLRRSPQDDGRLLGGELEQVAQDEGGARAVVDVFERFAQHRRDVEPSEAVVPPAAAVHEPAVRVEFRP